MTKIDHGHDFYEIVFVLQGWVIQVVDGNRKKMAKNSYMFLCPDNSHYFFGQSEDLKMVSLSVAADKFSDMIKATDIVPVFAKMFTYHGVVNRIIDKILLFSAENKKQNLNELLISLFFSCKEEMPAYVPTNVSYGLREMSDKENLKQGVRKWCELSGYSRMQLLRLCKKHYGNTPERIIHGLKMDKATEYLASTDLSVETIADLSGFESASRFYVAFKKEYGITPSKFRKAVVSPILVSFTGKKAQKNDIFCHEKA